MYSHGTYGLLLWLCTSLLCLSHHTTVTNDQTEVSKLRPLLPNLYYVLQAAAAE